MGASNCVAYMFKDKGVFSFSKELISEEELFEAAMEAGAEDLKDEGDTWEVVSAPEDFGAVRDELEKLGKEFEGELSSIPETTVTVSGKDAESLLKLLDMLDDLDDVQKVVANFEIDEEEMQRLAG